ncbi:hypothetical protein KBC85_00985 [Candidatus Saccharibacteria bacterium]|nr:hypothetical protein [Candidatus Saccharibacteria bacterium]MDQ5885010.1 hypothetical protein [Patescibacteria group bacterium]MDQ5953540.1 hypothetical protein [Patescibacteria group bacterium]
MPDEIKNDKTDEPKIDPPSLQNHSGKVIVPVSEQPEVANNKEADDNDVKPSPPVKEELPKPTKESPLSTDINIDSLSNDSITNNMQQPRIYDTKQYYVPINDTNHKHGFIVGTIIAGVVTAVLAVSVLAIISMSA